METRPSSAHRWVNCTASPALEALFPDVSGPEAQEGDAIHEAAAVGLQTGQLPAVDSVSSNGTVLTDERLEVAEEYLRVVRAAIPSHVTAMVERTVKLDAIGSGVAGTPDLAYIDYQAGELHVWDLKTGYGLVEAYENWQMICYLIGLLHMAADELGKPIGLIDQDFYAVAHIVQPRAFHSEGPVRSWRFKASDLRGYLNQLQTAVSCIRSGNNTQSRTGQHCINCRAMGNCETYHRATLNAMDVIGGTALTELTPEGIAIEISQLRRAAKLVSELLDARETQGAELIRGGVGLPGWGAEQGYGNPSWDKTDAEVFALGELFGIDLAKSKPLTPTQAKKAGIPEELIKAYSSKKPTRLKLVATDKTAAAKIFKQRPE